MSLKLHEILILFFLIFILTTITKAQTIRYVVQGGKQTKDGMSWDNASDDLQAMINSSSAEDQVWVATGTYKPNRQADDISKISLNNRNNAFVLKDGVKLYGGFLGVETILEDRNWDTNLTILSGVLDGDVRTYHVVVSVNDGNQTLLDGFTVTGASAPQDGNYAIIENNYILHQSGGGMINYESSPVIRNCFFTKNSVQGAGGGIENNHSSPEIINCIFSENSSNYAQVNGTGGGGIDNSRMSSPIIRNCKFLKNSSKPGGAMSNYNSSPTVVNSIFSGNSSYYAGSMYNIQSQVNVINCTFVGNSALYDYGGIRSEGGITTINNSIFWENGHDIFGPADVTYSIVEEGVAGEGNSHLDPLFIDRDGVDNIMGTIDDNLNLGTCSPAVDAGQNLGAPFSDILGNNIFNNTKDIGAYERQSIACPLYTGPISCESVILSDVKGRRWFRFIKDNKLIAEINPNGIDLGEITLKISDPTNVLSYNEHYFLGRAISITRNKTGAEDPVTSPYSLRLYYGNDEFEEYKSSIALSNIEDINVSWKEGGTACDITNYSGSNGLVTDVGSFLYGSNAFYLQFNLNHFTLFLASGASIDPLPVILTSFTGENNSSYNLIQWKTAAEVNHDHFEVERSSDALSFKKISEQLSDKQVNAVNINTYSYKDYNFENAVNYYRLKQIDVDGTFSYSRKIKINNYSSLKIYPNPVADLLNINVAAGSFKYSIINSSGILVKSGNASSSKSIPVTSLTPGIYIINFDNQSLKFFKN